MKNKDFIKLFSYAKKIQTLVSIEALLSWDQETYMPKEAIVLRSEQISLLSTIIHSYQTSKEYTRLLNNLIDIKTGKIIKISSLSRKEQAAVREWRKDYKQMICLPSSFVEKFSLITSKATHVWIEARKKKDFSLFCPDLKQIISLCKQKADYLGFKKHPYDALVDLYEPGITTEKLDQDFSSLKPKLISLLNKIKNKKQIDTKCLFSSFDHAEQIKIGHMILELMNFSKTSSRLDESTHPFTIGLHPDDVRLTTRVMPNYLMSNILSVLHEGGHGLYESNLPSKYFGTPLCQAVSLGFHESQSRFWETFIGKGKAFWTYFYPKIQKNFSKQLKNISLDQFYKAINRVEPSLIRVESDEITYCLHIILRYELEKGLLEGSIKAEDIPDLWNEKMNHYFGIIPDNDAQGCLQDIHWSSGLIGYFPTYALGNIYAGQIYKQFIKENPLWEKKVKSGKLEFIRLWLKEKIHQYGRYYSPQELIKKVTKKSFNSKDYIFYLTNKFSQIYP